MTSDKQYEILDGLPPYGPMYIPISSDESPFYSEGYVVRFKKSDGEKWVANFKPGWTDFYKIFNFPKHNTIVVFAGGQAYIMNPNQQKPKMTFGPTIKNVIQKEDGSLICSDNTHVLLFDNKTGETWKSDRISLDGIKDIKLIDKKISGQSFDPMDNNHPWCYFEIDLETKEIVGGSYEDFRARENYQKTSVNSKSKEKTVDKNPWWKIW